MTNRGLILWGLLIVVAAAPCLRAEKPRLGDLPEPDAKKTQKPPPPANDDITPEERKKMIAEVVADFYERGARALREGRLEQAEGFFDRVLILQPDHAGARQGINRIMQIYDKRHPVKKEQDPRQASLDRMVREFEQYYSDGNWDKAYTAGNRVLNADSNHLSTRQKMVVVQRNLYNKAIQRARDRENASDYEGAIEAYQTALAYRVEAPVRDKIKTLKEKISERNVKKSDELYLQALNESQQGRVDKAIELCRRALDLNPDNIQAQRMMERLRSKAL